MIFGDESNALLPPLAQRRQRAALHSCNNREAGPDFSMTVQQAIMQRVSYSIIWRISVIILPERQFCAIVRDLNGDGLQRSGISVKTHEKYASPIDHRCQDGAVKRKIRDI